MTLAELSKKIGVSTATISRVLNDDGSVSAATKEKILHDLEAYGYQKRPRRKSSLVQNSDTALALIGKLTNPIAVAFLNGIHESLQAKGKRLLISVTDYDGVQELVALQYANRNGYCGVFLLNAVENPALISLLQDYPLPVVLVNRYLKALDLDVVTVDNYRCGYLATTYLQQKGHTKIAHIAGPESSITCQNRCRGYMDAMRDADLPCDCVYRGDRTYKSGYEIGTHIAALPREQLYTAIYCVNGSMAAGLQDAFRQAGIFVPDDISLICNDTVNETLPGYLHLTSVDQEPQVMGSAAVDLLFERISNPQQPPHQILYSPALQECGSVKQLIE